MTNYRKLNDYTLKATDSLADNDEWGAPKLSRIFNFKSQQVTTLYERGGVKDYKIPRSGSSYSAETGYTAAVTGSVQIQNFSDIESDEEIATMHRILVEKGGKPPAVENVLLRPGKKRAGLG